MATLKRDPTLGNLYVYEQKKWNIMMEHMIKTTSSPFSQVVYVVKCMHV